MQVFIFINYNNIFLSTTEKNIIRRKKCEINFKIYSIETFEEDNLVFRKHLLIVGLIVTTPKFHQKPT